MLSEVLKKEWILAMKSKDIPKKSILGMVKSAAQEMAKLRGDEINDNDIKSAAKSLVNKNKETIDGLIKLGTGQDKIDVLEYENSVLFNHFLPKQLSETEMDNAIDEELSNLESLNGANPGMFIPAIKNKYGAESLDMKYLGKKVKEKLDEANMQEVVDVYVIAINDGKMDIEGATNAYKDKYKKKANVDLFRTVLEQKL